MRKYIIIFLFCTPAYADITGISDIEIISQLMEQYKIMIKQLREIKAQNRTLDEVRNLYKQALNTYETVVNIDMDEIENRIISDFRGLTELDDMDGMDLMDKLKTIERELDRRIETASPENRENVERVVGNQKSLLNKYATMIDLEKALHQNLKESNKDIGLKKAVQIQAQNNTILSILGTLEAKERVVEAMAEQEGELHRENMEAQMRTVYKSLEKTNW
ncbi:MAG: hypothetical protein ACE5EH_11805 [Gammaproteobacteria bacterium]